MTITEQKPLDALLNALEEKGDGQLVLCRLCKAPITRSTEKIDVGLSHQHRFTNPAGISYTIGCFQQAPGCNISGTPTAEHSWFSGYRWQLAICTDCHEHLGWYYENQQRGFFGLIQSRVTAANQ